MLFRSPRIGFHSFVQLVVADIDGIDAGRPALQQHLGEATGGRAEIEAHLASGVDATRLEPATSFSAARET